MSPRRTVSFHPSTYPAADSNYVPIVPGTEIYLRNCQTWIPVQVLDMILLRLLVTSGNPDRIDYSRPSYHNPPYTDLLYDFSFITSFPITSEMVSEVEEMRLGRPPLPAEPTAVQLKQWVLWQDFDKMHEKWINLQRQRVEESKEGSRLAKTTVARIPPPITSASLRAQLNRVAARNARCRAVAMRIEADEITDVVQKIALGLGGFEHSGGKARKRGLCELPASPGKMRRLR